MTRDAERVGHIIRYNFIADTPGETYVKHLGKHQTVGIYLDNFSSNCLIYGNIIVRVANSGILVHSGKNNVIENNIIVDNEWQMTFMEVWVPFGRGFMTNNFFQRNIVYYTDNYAHRTASVFHLNPWTERVVARSDYNLFFNEGGWGYPIMHIDSYMNMDSANLFEAAMIKTPVEHPITSLEQWQKRGYDTHSVIADPLFVDWEHDDYRLKPESPALKLGFQSIDIGRIGIRKRTEK